MFNNKSILLLIALAITNIAHADLSSGLVAHYPFNGNANDASGNGNNGTVHGATLTTDRFGKANSAYSFDGVNDYIYFGKVLPDMTNMAVAFWVNTATTDNSSIFCDGDWVIGNDVTLYIPNNTVINVRADKNGYSLADNIDVGVNLIGSWNHIVWTMSGMEQKIYIDGVLKGTLAKGGSNVNYHNFILGTEEFGKGSIGWRGYWQGKLADFRIYNRDLSTSEVTELYNLGNSSISATLESPQQNSYESGIGLIRGWVCQANKIEIQIDNGAKQQVAYGTNRGDTQVTCGHSATGFGFTYNWNSLSNGTHNLKAFADNTQFADVNFTTTNLGTNYLTGASGQHTLNNFPSSGKSATLKWSEPHQNFVIANATRTAPHINQLIIRAGITGNLESPQPGSYESGIGLIRGWVCQANAIELQIDGGTKHKVAYGTPRGDTQTNCGHSNTGFGFVYNWNSLSDGTHNLRLFVDNQEFTNVNFNVTTLGSNYLQGINREEIVTNFPQNGRNVKVRWAEPHQNFVIAGTPNITCNYNISPSSANFPATGGTSTVNVSAETGCNWTATTNNTSWITITQGSSGSGNGTVALSASNNTSTNSRAATLTIAGKTFTAQQDGASIVNKSNLTPYKPADWSDKIVVSNITGTTTDSNTLKNSDTLYIDWAVINNGNADANGYSVTLYVDNVNKGYWNCNTVAPANGYFYYCYAVDINIGSLSVGTHVVKIVADSTNIISESNESDNTYEKTITVTSVETCNYSISPSSQSFTSNGGTGSINVSTGSGCNWSASSNANWISITSGNDGTGNGTVNYSVINNSSTNTRSGTVTIAGKTFTAQQSGANGNGGVNYVGHWKSFDALLYLPCMAAIQYGYFFLDITIQSNGNFSGQWGGYIYYPLVSACAPNTKFPVSGKINLTNGTGTITIDGKTTGMKMNRKDSDDVYDISLEPPISESLKVSEVRRQ